MSRCVDKFFGIVHKSSHGIMENSSLQSGVHGFVDLFKTTSNLYVADGLIFKGLIYYFSMITNHSDLIQRRKPLKISPLLD